MKKPKKWTEVYPAGTKEGDEERKFFIALARNQKWPFRSVASIIQDSGLPQERVEQILEKYVKMGMIFPHKSNEDHWGYWERAPEMLKKEKPLAKKDQGKRIKRYLEQAADGDDVEFDI